MKGHVRKFTKDKIKTAIKQGRFEELATLGL
jgi:hypothetical protein